MPMHAVRTIRSALIGSIALLLPQSASAAAVSITFNPSNFSHPLRIDNKYFKLVPGTTLVFRGRTPGEGCETIRTKITNETRLVAGVATRVVHDLSYADPQCSGDLSKIEDTLDFYAQDDAGNVWYMGERSRTCEDDKCTLNDGSWIAGEDLFNTGTNAQAGIQMLAQPHVGDSYRQELYRPNAVDEGQVDATGVTVKLTRTNALPPKTFSDCIKIKETAVIEPGVVGFKYYCPKVSLVLETETGDFRAERVVEGPADALEFRTVK